LEKAGGSDATPETATSETAAPASDAAAPTT
jgi:hypothetical protein